MILTATHAPTGASIHFQIQGERLCLGRQTEHDGPDKLSVPFDPKLSRRLARLEVQPNSLVVVRDESRFPLFHQGQERDHFTLKVGERFSSGETVFELSPSWAHTLTVNVADLDDSAESTRILKILLDFQDLIQDCSSVTELAPRCERLLGKLLDGAEIALVEAPTDGPLRVLGESSLMPCSSLIFDCLLQELTVYHLWPAQGGEVDGQQWALAAPVPTKDQRLALYATGFDSLASPGDLVRNSLALIATVLGKHLEARRTLRLELQIEREAKINQFLCWQHLQLQETIEKLRASQSQLVRTSQWAAAGRLAANGAHELNTPLAAIKLTVESVLSRLPDLSEASTASLKSVLRSVERCQAVTQRFLVYSRLEEPKKPEAFALESVVEDCLEALEPFLKSKMVEVTRVGLSWQVLADRQDCYWAITNLPKNAGDAFDSSAQSRTIRISAELHQSNVHLTIEDSGSGVPEELKDQIFEPFTSTKKIGEGSGLGLAISRRNVRAWGGDLQLSESRLGGAAFVLELPQSEPSR